MDLLLPLILSAVVTMVLIPLLERYAQVLRVVDMPGPRKVHARPMPRVGGPAMAMGAAISVVIWLPLDQSTRALLLAGLVVLLFGIWDDRRNLPAFTKLVGQSAAAMIVMFYGDVMVRSLYFTSRIELPDWAVVPLTYFFLIGVTNAINLADGLDGLAGGAAFLCCAAITALGLNAGLTEIAVAAVAVMGALLGFLRYNTYPARVFMGDSGSQFIGFTLGVLTIQLTQEPGTPYSAALPLLLLGLPIIDTLIVMVLRLREGRSPFSADRRHLHHRLLNLGFDHFEAVTLVYTLQASLFLFGWLMRYESDAVILAAFLAFGGFVLGTFGIADRMGWSRQHPPTGGLGAFVGSVLPWLKGPSGLPRWANLVVWVCVASYGIVIGSTSTSTSIDKDVALMSLVLAVVLLLAAGRALPTLVRAGLAHACVFVGIAVVVYVDHSDPQKLGGVTFLKWVVFPLLTVAVLARLRFWRERRFDVTTLDILIVFLAIAVPNLPGLQGGPSSIGLSMVKLLVLMYGSEMLLAHSERTRRWMWLSASIFLGITGLRGGLALAG